MNKRTARTLVALLAGALVLMLPLVYLRATADGAGNSTRRAAPPPRPVVAAAGDIACDPRVPQFVRPTINRCQQLATSNLIIRAHPTAVLALGDDQYKSGILRAFQKSYDKSWGRLIRVTHPVPGNHEYGNQDAQGYFDYFGARAGDRDKGYYSYDIDNWHVIALNSECPHAGGCRAGSPQERWLRDDLAKSTARCTLAYWHQPLFSSGVHGNDATYTDFWEDLYESGAEIVLNGHDHDYERFAPQTPHAVADSNRGIREFVVGTGGETLYKLHETRANSQVRQAGVFGVLLLTLGEHSYDWKFESVAPATFSDQGSGRCH